MVTKSYPLFMKGTATGKLLHEWVGEWYPGTVQEFSQQIGVSRDNVYKSWFRGDLSPSQIRTLYKALKADTKVSKHAIANLQNCIPPPTDLSVSISGDGNQQSLFGSSIVTSTGAESLEALKRENELLREMVELLKKRISDLEK